MKKISFDFDNTIAMSYLDMSQDPPPPIFQTYNDEIVEKIKNHIKEGDDLYIVTARTPELENYYPDQSVKTHLEKLGLNEYFWPDKVIFTSGGTKFEILTNLGVSEHYDDSIEEHFDSLQQKYKVLQPLDHFKDSEFVGKVVIFDDSERLLILQRSDEGNLCDLPGGHLKHIEIQRGEQGEEEGTDREVFEETGIVLPFLKLFMSYEFNHKGILHHIYLFLSKIDEVTPDIRLDLQDHVENIDYKWVTLKELSDYMGKTTNNLRHAYDELSIQDEIFEQNEPFQRKMKRKHRNMKKKLIGLGKNKHFGGGKGHERPSMERSKSAPPGFGAIGEGKNPKKLLKIRKIR